MRKPIRPVALIVALGLLALHGCGSGAVTEKAVESVPQPSAEETTLQESSTAPAEPFVQEQFVNRRTINYVSSEPSNNALLTTPPANVTIRFSKGLGAGSFIEVTREERPVTSGPVVIAPDNLSMTVPVAAGVTGNYKVKYAAYFFSGYYEEGSFGFSVQVQ